jgi:putative nucleotidyltransferase-like protein
LAPAELDDLMERHVEQLGLDLRLEHLLCDAATLLDESGIDYRALKGPVLAHTVYRDPALRSFGDIDILVSGTDFGAAITALEQLGFRRRFIEPRDGFDARFSKGSCLERGDGMEIDLHRTLAPGPFGVLLGYADLIARPPQHLQLGWCTIAAPDRELAFVHACFHATLGDFPARLVPLRDICELLRRGIDVAAVIELLTSANCATVLQRALTLVERELGVVADGELAAWAGGHVPSRFDRWALSTYERADRSYAAQAAVSVWAMPSMRERVAYASALVLPSREYVRAREVRYGARIRRSMNVAREWRPR